MLVTITKPSQPDLLTFASAKISKTKAHGSWEAVCYMSPARESVPFGGVNMCANAGSCEDICLGKTSGMMTFSTSKNARIRRTLMFLRDRDTFLSNMKREALAHVRRAKRAGMVPALRPNGSSDNRGLGKSLALWAAAEVPELRVYDYTKIDPTREVLPNNYRLVYSYSERHEAKEVALRYLQQGGTVAVCFSTKKGEDLPDQFLGYPVIDGDERDDRFNDPPGVVVGLRAKGAARKGSKFVVKI